MCARAHAGLFSLLSLIKSWCKSVPLLLFTQCCQHKELVNFPFPTVHNHLKKVWFNNSVPVKQWSKLRIPNRCCWRRRPESWTPWDLKLSVWAPSAPRREQTWASPDPGPASRRQSPPASTRRRTRCTGVPYARSPQATPRTSSITCRSPTLPRSPLLAPTARTELRRRFISRYTCGHTLERNPMLVQCVISDRLSRVTWSGI